MVFCTENKIEEELIEYLVSVVRLHLSSIRNLSLDLNLDLSDRSEYWNSFNSYKALERFEMKKDS